MVCWEEYNFRSADRSVFHDRVHIFSPQLGYDVGLEAGRARAGGRGVGFVAEQRANRLQIDWARAPAYPVSQLVIRCGQLSPVSTTRVLTARQLG